MAPRIMHNGEYPEYRVHLLKAIEYTHIYIVALIQTDLSSCSHTFSSLRYVFARKDFNFKQRWPHPVEEGFSALLETKIGSGGAHTVRDLEAGLIQYELRIKPDQPLHSSLARAFKSEADLFKQ